MSDFVEPERAVHYGGKCNTCVFIGVVLLLFRSILDSRWAFLPYLRNNIHLGFKFKR